MFEIEIRYYRGVTYRVLAVERFEDWTAARRRIRQYNEDRKSTRYEAHGPWPVI